MFPESLHRRIAVPILKLYWGLHRLSGRNRASWNDQYLRGKWNCDRRSANTIARVVNLCRGGRLIEFGCGSGDLPHVLPAGTFSTYLGIDISDVAIAKAKQLAHERQLKACEFSQMDMTRWPGDAGVSLVLVEECLYYLDEKAQEAFLLGCCRSLAEEGRILVVVHDGVKHARTLATCRRLCRVVKDEVIVPRTYLTLSPKASM